MVKPNFFIVGAPKCGTTALYRYLSAHPDIFMPGRKEPHFFGSDLEHVPIDARSLDEYLALFAPAGDKKRVGEASVWYLVSQTAAQEIAAFNPEARIIIMLREPVDMLHSLYHHLLYSGSETEPTFEAALAAEPDRRAGRRLPPSRRRRQSLYYREIAAYTAQVERYFDAFGRDAVHVILFDDLKRDAAGMYRDVLAFLEVDPDFRVDFKRVNESRRIRSWRLHVAYSLAFRRSMDYLRGPALHAMRKGTGILRSLNTAHAPRPPLDPELRQRLRREFEPEVMRLGDLLGRDLSHWCATDE